MTTDEASTVAKFLIVSDFLSGFADPLDENSYSDVPNCGSNLLVYCDGRGSNQDIGPFPTWMAKYEVSFKGGSVPSDTDFHVVVPVGTIANKAALKVRDVIYINKCFILLFYI